MFLARRPPTIIGREWVKSSDYVRVPHLDLTTLGPLEKLFLLPDEQDNQVQTTVGKIWVQGYSICVLIPLGYNVEVKSDRTALVWIEDPTLHVMLPPGWSVIVESTGIDCHRHLLMAQKDEA